MIPFNSEIDGVLKGDLCRYFFTVANYFLYGESMIYYFKHIVFVDAYFIPFARHHRFLSFMLYIFGFMAFVSGLKRTNLKHQFGLFCWVHMSLLLTVYSSHFIVNNILEGLIWLWVPASLVICNDIFAYVCGMMFGRTPLISLSPKKTMEGFFGAFVITVVFGYGWGSFFQQFNYMVRRVRKRVDSLLTMMSDLPGRVAWDERVQGHPVRAEPRLSVAVRAAARFSRGAHIAGGGAGPAHSQARVGRDADCLVCLHAVSAAHARHGGLCESGCAVWWLLCQRFQACL